MYADWFELLNYNTWKSSKLEPKRRDWMHYVYDVSANAHVGMDGQVTPPRIYVCDGCYPCGMKVV